MGGVRVAIGDITGDGVPDIVTAPGIGGGPHVKVFDSVTFKLVGSYFAYDPKFTGGVNLAVGDVNGDGYAEVITAPSSGGGPQVRIHDGFLFSPLANNPLLPIDYYPAVNRSFFAEDAGFRGGLNIAAGDVDGDGKADIITIPSKELSPFSKVFSGATGEVIRNYNAGNIFIKQGAALAAADFNNDGCADVVLGALYTTGTYIQIFDGKTGSAMELKSFVPVDDHNFGNIHLAAGDFNDDGTADLIVAPGRGTRPFTQVYDGVTLKLISESAPFGTFSGGIFVAAAG